MSDDQQAVVLISADLLFASRIRATVEELGGRLQILSSVDDEGTWVETSRPALVLVDLEAAGLKLDQLMRDVSGYPDTMVVAYGPHVHQQRLEAARQAGCHEVLTRGQFDATRADLLRRYSFPP